MTILVIILALWIASAVIRSAKETKRKRAEAQRSADLRRMTAEFRAQKAQAELEAKRMAEIEREQLRQAKEQEKQAAILEKHEKRIASLEYKVRKFDRDIEAQNELLADYYAQLDWFLLQQSGTVPGGKEFTAWQNKIVTKNNQIRKAENKIADMKDAKAMAERELAA
jgi:hypothetical protein